MIPFNWLLILLLFILFLIFNLYLFPKSFKEFENFKMKPLDLKLGYNKDYVLVLFEKLGENGRQQYKKALWTLDFIYPMIYNALLVLLLKTLIQNPDYQWLMYLPFTIMILDYIENSNTTYFINRYPKMSEKHVAFASVVTVLKWGFAVVNILLVIIFLM